MGRPLSISTEMTRWKGDVGMYTFTASAAAVMEPVVLPNRCASPARDIFVLAEQGRAKCNNTAMCKRHPQGGGQDDEDPQIQRTNSLHTTTTMTTTMTTTSTITSSTTTSSTTTTTTTTSTSTSTTQT
jgi:hypothetical protein